MDSRRHESGVEAAVAADHATDRLVFPWLKLLSGSEKMRLRMEMLESGLLRVKRDLFQIPKAAEVGRDARRRTS
jgi:hypothetical protein